MNVRLLQGAQIERYGWQFPYKPFQWPSPLKIGYWETYDGSQIRELEGSQTDSINGMDINGSYFVTGGGDKLVKVRWSYP